MIGRLATKRIGLPRAVALATCVCTGILFSFSPVTGQEKALKKLYISSISADGVSAALAKKARERLEFALYESFGKEYRVLTDEDVKVMFKKAGEIMATGCSAESCQQQMADAVDADEIIYGELSSEGAALKLSARTLLRDRKTLSVTKKSMVMLGFAEKDLDHYCGEAARKLVNPAYAVQKPPKAAFEEKISLSAVKVEAVKGLDIGVLKFTADDETIQNMLGYLKNLVQEGDDAFGKKKYDDALGKYTTVLDKVKTKLTAEKQEKMVSFRGGVVKRCDAAYAMKYKVIIEALDAELSKGGNVDEKALMALRGRYGKVEEDETSTPAELKGPGMAEIGATLLKRYDSITAALAALREKKGDALYGEYAFASALVEYDAANNYAGGIRDAAMRNGLAARYADKRKAAGETGRNYLLSRVRALADRAEFFNLQDKNAEAKAALDEARKIANGDLSIFATSALVERYNSVADLLGVGALSEKNDARVFAPIREQELIAKEARMKEAAKKREEMAKKREEERRQEEERMRAETQRMAAEAQRNFKIKGGGREVTVGGIAFVYIPGGTFMMGSPDDQGMFYEHPRHKVTLNGFWMSKYEVTQAQYTAIMGNNPSRDNGDDKPVECVSWNNAAAFCERLSSRTGSMIRLPTEAEWEFACRAGTSTKYSWGDEIDGDYCWYSGNSGYVIHQVGAKKPNAWGLYDMSGNVSEWCDDWYDVYYYQNSSENNPRGAKGGTGKSDRGGSYYDGADSVRSAKRDAQGPDFENQTIGFRIVKTN